MKLLMFLTLSLVTVSLIGCFGKTDTSANKAANSKSSAEKRNINGMVITELKAGTGITATPGLPVVVHYTGWLFDQSAPENKGKKFDSSKDRNQPFTFRLGSGMVIEGWDKGVAGMKTGEKRRLVIPPKMAYGDGGAGSAIPPGATLVFDVELIEVKN